MNPDYTQFIEKAVSSIQSQSQNIASDYTLGWMGPAQKVAQDYPHASTAIESIQDTIVDALPIFIFIDRGINPEECHIVVPHLHRDNLQTRVIASKKLSKKKKTLFGDYISAIWFLIQVGKLANPAQANDQFRQQLTELTGPDLFEV